MSCLNEARVEITAIDWLESMDPPDCVHRHPTPQTPQPEPTGG